MQEVDGSIPFSSTNLMMSDGGTGASRVASGPSREAPVMVFVLLVLAAASRLLPHPPNFAPVAAMGLFAGAFAGRRGAWLVAFGALVASDVVLGFYHPMSMFWNYLAFAACLLLGSGWLQRTRTFTRVAGAVLASAVTFFVISNFGMWASGYYPRTWAGLVECYVQALPFFRNTLASDVLYSAVLFGGHALFSRWLARPTPVTARG